jgi:hypothetical protein
MNIIKTMLNTTISKIINSNRAPKQTYRLISSKVNKHYDDARSVTKLRELHTPNGFPVGFASTGLE